MPPAGIAAGIVAAWGVTNAIAVAAITVASYAVVGAAIGGLSAAVMGGDIGKGILFGAIGGAVAGGVSIAAAGGINAYNQGVQTAINSGKGTVSAASMAKNPSGLTSTKTVVNSKDLIQQGVQSESMLTKMGPALAEGGIGLAGSMLASQDAEDMAKEQRSWDAEQAKIRHQENLEKIAASNAGGGGGGAGENHSLEIAKMQDLFNREELAERRRQWEVTRDDAMEKINARKGALQGIRASREGTPAPKNTPGIDRQGNADIPALFGETPAPLLTEEEEALNGAS